MRYVGGKDRLASKIADVILSNTDNRSSYLEPFLGGGSTFGKIAPHFEYSIGSDAHEDLMLMWESFQSGWEPPTDISEEKYYQLKVSQPSDIRGLVGFGSSFGGKWWGGYARGKTADARNRNYLAETVRNLNKIMGKLKPYPNTMFVHQYYENWEALAGDVVYADPPYASTQGYSGTTPFDSAMFWKTMENWADNGADVYVSEYTAPGHWKCIAEFDHRQSLSLSEDRFETTEKLWHL